MNTPITQVGDVDVSATSGPISAVDRFVKGWDRFWFSAADPTVLGFIRICTGIVLLFVHLCYSYDLMGYVHPDKSWLDQEAIDFVRNDYPIFTQGSDWTSPPEQVGKGLFTWSIFYHLHDPRAIWIVHITILAIMALFTLGVCTRITSVLAWAGAMCYIQRIPTQLFGMDTMQTILMLYLMIGPSGAALSLDRLWYLWRERRKRHQPDWSPPPPASVSANVALRLIQVHFCIIYLAAGTSKLLGAAWWNGTALWYCWANYAFAPMEFPLYQSFLKLLVENRALAELCMAGGVAFTLFMEIGLPFLVWIKQCRWLMVLGAMLLHFGIGTSMGLVSFSMYMMLMAFAFAPPETVHWLLSGPRKLLPGGFRWARGANAAPEPAPHAHAESLALSH